MTTSVTRPFFAKQYQTYKTKTKTKTDFFLVSDWSCPKTDGLRPYHYVIGRAAFEDCFAINVLVLWWFKCDQRIRIGYAHPGRTGTSTSDWLPHNCVSCLDIVISYSLLCTEKDSNILTDCNKIWFATSFFLTANTKWVSVLRVLRHGVHSCADVLTRVEWGQLASVSQDAIH